MVKARDTRAVTTKNLAGLETFIECLADPVGIADGSGKIALVT